MKSYKLLESRNGRFRTRLIVVSLFVIVALPIILSFYPVIVSAMVVANLTQNAYRWRNDDGSQTTATWKAAANTSVTGITTGSTGEIIRLRFDVRETNAVSTAVSPRIEFGTNSDCVSGSWTALNTSSTTWQLVASSNFADGDATTQQLSAGTFVAGRMSESSNPTASITLSNQVTDVEYSMRGTLAAGNTTYYFRVTNNGTALNTYTNCATLTTAAVTKVVYTTSARTLTAGTCSGAGNIITIQLQDTNSNPANPSGATTIRISSDSPSETIYSDNTCTTTLTNGDISFTTSENSKSFYVIDTRKSNPTWTVTASKQSGPDSISSANQSMTVNAGSVTRLVITLPGQTFTDGTGNSGSTTNRTAGTSFTITGIAATDSYFNVNTGYSGSKTLAYSGPASSPAPSSTAPSYTTSVSFTSGQSTTTLTTTLYRAESVTITATDGGSYGYASSSVTVDTGALYDYTVSANTPITAGTCSTTSNSITAYDQWDNTRSTDTSVVNMTTSGTGITFYTTSGCSVTTTQYTLSSGTVNFYYRTTKKQSGITITATKNLDTPTGTSGSITVNPAAVSTLVIKLPGQTFTDGTGITGSTNFTGLRTPNATAGTSFTLDIKAIDAYNNLVDSGPSNYTGSKTISYASSAAGNAPSGQTPSFPSTSLTFTNGEANSLSATYYNATTGRDFRADDTGTPVTGTASTSFTVQAGAMQNYGVSASTPQTAGVAFNVTITARDTWNNSLGSLYSAPVGSYTWTTTANSAPDSTAPNIGTLAQGDFSSGSATKSVTLYKAESGVTLTATEPSTGNTGTSSSVTVNPGNISANSSDSSVSGAATGTPSVNATITITLLDTWRNPKSGVTAANIVLSGTGSPSVTQPSVNTDANGQTTGQLNWAGTGTYTVSVQITTVSLVQNDGTTADADGYLDDTHSITILGAGSTSSGIQGGANIRGGTRIQ